MAKSGKGERKEVVRMTVGELSWCGASALALVIADLCVFVFTAVGPG
jgi:hypothetical protein